MTLATLANRLLGRTRVAMVHAVSPAVPPEATGRVRRLAESEGWDLSVLDAGEFADARYVHNPINRCYLCKTHLYDAISGLSDRPILSGTNLDDLAEYHRNSRRRANIESVILMSRRASTSTGCERWRALLDSANLRSCPPRLVSPAASRH